MDTLSWGVTRAINFILSYPASVIKTQLQLDVRNQKYSGTIDCLLKIVHKNGFSGLYRGIGIILIGSIPQYAIRLVVYRQLANRLQEENGKLTLWNNYVASVSSGIVEAAVAIAPVDTIQIKLINDMQREKPRYQGSIHGFNTIIQKYGIRGIYNGTSATVLKMITHQTMRFLLIYMYTECNSIWKVHLSLVLAAFAAIASLLISMGLDVIKTQMQGSPLARYRKSMICVIKMLRQEGVSVFFKGAAIRLTYMCLDAAICFIFFNGFSDFVQEI